VIGRDGVAGLFCLAVAVVLFVASRGLPQPALVPIGPAFYPRILFGVTAVLSIVLLASDVLRRRRPAVPPAQYRLVLATFGLFAAYVALLPPLGYRVATFLFVGALQIVLERPRSAGQWALMIVVALVTTVVTYLVFESYLSVLLPRGRLTDF
jgi:hypothetical protein